MLNLFVYNTLTRQKEKFEPLHPPFTGMYLCGPTVYGDAHLGHARPAITFDIVYRYLTYMGMKVRYVRNITDVGHLTGDSDDGEDKLQKKAKADRLEPMEIAQRYTDSYHFDMDALNVLRPSIEPRATGHIPEQIEMIEKILANGFAYIINGSVYFDTLKYNEVFGYGELSGRNLEEIVSGYRENLEGQDEKRHPADFALWKKADESHLMKWSSPWSTGFPGWHIECSAMSTKYLGEKYDIHGGGLDLIFPHHEAEIAQSNACNHAPGFDHYGEAKYWLHCNMITLEGQKMAKSLGNGINLKELYTGKHPLLEQAYSPMTIRFYILQAHYRSTIDFSNVSLQSAEKALKRITDALKRLREIKGENRLVALNEDMEKNLKTFREDAESFMNDDFNTAKTIARFFEVVPVINQLYADRSGPLAVSAETLMQFSKEFETFFFDILGLKTEEDSAGGESDGMVQGLMNVITSIRSDARKDKNFKVSDFIRDELIKMNIKLKDTPQGTEWIKE
ncbi:MAG: cysteine--tRNA ligase [Bacteroidia bacterium]|nr:cysteine--tRNA ligase [Bacteroidia bacterium]